MASRESDAAHFKMSESTSGGPDLGDLSRKYGYTFPQLQDILTHYNQIDKDGDGAITQRDMTIAFKQLGLNPKPATLLALIREVDSNKNGQVEFNEFVALHYKLNKGGNSNWTKFLDMSRPASGISRTVDTAVKQGRKTAKTIRKATVRFMFGEEDDDDDAVEPLMHSQGKPTEPHKSKPAGEWAKHSFFERKDVEKPPEPMVFSKVTRAITQTVRGGRATGATVFDTLLDPELLDEDDNEDEENELASDSSFEFYSDTDEEEELGGLDDTSGFVFEHGEGSFEMESLAAPAKTTRHKTKREKGGNDAQRRIKSELRLQREAENQTVNKKKCIE
eukprot:Lithocolla_globosa_v1_NODE_2289_length_2065_cov_3.461194.p1 type:complete len:334 gc:universal NODE_2289_length_2065_cov_3.461194:108-1109(+)